MAFESLRQTLSREISADRDQKRRLNDPEVQARVGLLREQTRGQAANTDIGLQNLKMLIKKQEALNLFSELQVKLENVPLDETNIPAGAKAQLDRIRELGDPATIKQEEDKIKTIMAINADPELANKLLPAFREKDVQEQLFDEPKTSDILKARRQEEQKGVAEQLGAAETFSNVASPVGEKIGAGQPLTGEEVAGLKPRVSPSGDLSKTQNDLFFKFQDRAQKFSGDFEVMQRNLGTIEASVNRLEAFPENEENRLAVQQAIITSFNKITDPTSVVRESEYARTPEGASVINRLRGFVEKITKGGKLVTQDNVEIRDTARTIAKIHRRLINEKLEEQIREPARRRGGFNDRDIEAIAPLFEELQVTEPSPVLNTGGTGQVSTIAPQDSAGGVQSSGTPELDYLNSLRDQGLLQ